MKRSAWLSLVDFLAFVSFLFVIATGLLIQYVLPPGSGGLEAHGTGWRAATRPVALVWGLARHEWGAIHFWLSVVFLVTVAIHLVIHRRWIVARFRGNDRHVLRMQAAIGIGALLGLLALSIALVLGPREEMTRSELQRQQQGQESVPNATPP